MKRCPDCRRDYYDETLLYCLDDGTALLEGPGLEGFATAIMPGGEAPTRAFERASEGVSRKPSSATPQERRRRLTRVSIGAVLSVALCLSAYILWVRSSGPAFSGSFRDVNSAAYDYYLRGKLDSTSENRERNENAIRVLEKVVSADPSFAPAHAELARAYSIKAAYYAAETQKNELYDAATHAVEKSLALDPNLAEGHFVRAIIIWTPQGRFPHEQAVQSLKRAITLDPGLEEAHHQLGVVYYHIGLLDKGQAELETAISINPTDALARMRIGLISGYRTDYERALRTLKTVPAEVNPPIFNRSLANVLFSLGETDEAAKVVDEFLTSYPDEGGNVTSVKAMLLAKDGKREEAEKAIRRAIEIGQGYQHFHHTTYNIASAYALIDDHAQALKWLEYTADDGFPCYPLFKKDKALDNIRADPQFIAFMTKMKQQWQRYTAAL